MRTIHSLIVVLFLISATACTQKLNGVAVERSRTFCMEKGLAVETYPLDSQWVKCSDGKMYKTYE